MAHPISGAEPSEVAGAPPTEAPPTGTPAGPPGGPPAEPVTGPGPGEPGPGAPAGRPGEQPPGTEVGKPAEVELPPDFDPLSYLRARTAEEPTLDSAGRDLYKQRVAFGRQGGEIDTLRRQLADTQSTIMHLQRQAATEPKEGEGDVYDLAKQATERSFGVRPDPEENPEGVMRWDANLNSSVTQITMDRVQRSSMADFQGSQIAEQFLEQLPPEHQVEFSYQVNSLLGEGFPRSNLSWDLLSIVYQGLMLPTATENAYRAGATARAGQITEAQLGGPPIHAGPGGGPSPPTAEGWTYESLIRAATEGTIEGSEFDRVMKELVRTGKAPARPER